MAEFNSATLWNPIEFEEVEERILVEPISDDLLVPGDMGEVFDAACAYMQEVNDFMSWPSATNEVLREVLVGSLAFAPEPRRH